MRILECPQLFSTIIRWEQDSGRALMSLSGVWALTGCGEFPEFKHSTLEGSKKTDSQEAPQISDSQGHTLPKVTQTLRKTKKSESDAWSCLAVLQRAPELQLTWGPLTLGWDFRDAVAFESVMLISLHPYAGKQPHKLIGSLRWLLSSTQLKSVWEKITPIKNMPPLTCFGQACGRIIFIHYWHEEVHITGLVPSWTGNPGYIQTLAAQTIKSKPISSIPSPISALALPPGSCLPFLGDIVWPEGHSWNNPFLSQIAVSGGLYYRDRKPTKILTFWIWWRSFLCPLFMSPPE